MTAIVEMLRPILFVSLELQKLATFYSGDCVVMHVMQLAAKEKTALTVQHQGAVIDAALTGNLLNSNCQDLVWQ